MTHISPDVVGAAKLQAYIVRAQEGDTEAYAKIYDHFFTAVYRYVAFRLPTDIVEDIVADIFLRAWEKLHTYNLQKGVPFAAWLFRIARNIVIDAYRTYRAWEEVPDSIVDTDASVAAERFVEKRDTLRVVRTAVEQLPRRYQEIILLAYVAELSHNDIARVLKISEGAVRILKMRALRKFEDCLPQEYVPSSTQKQVGIDVSFSTRLP